MRPRGLVWGLLVLLGAGCSGQPETPVEVRGQVFFQGKPLEGGTIVFVPDQTRGGSGPLACAEVEPDGRYRLRTGTAFGAVPGWYRVTVAPAGASIRTLPLHFSDPDLSDQSKEVKRGRENVIDVHLD